MILKRYPTENEFMELAETSNVVPVCAELLADTETPVSILQKFYKPDEPVFLLESVEGGEHWARYSFMGLSAKTHVKVFKEHVTIEENGGTRSIEHNGDPMLILKNLTKAYKPADMPSLPRFWSGLTGYMTYEMVSFFENIPTALPDGTPYAYFIIPDAMIIFDNMNHTLTCLAISCTQNKDSKRCYHDAAANLDKMVETIQSKNAGHNSLIEQNHGITGITAAMSPNPNCSSQKASYHCHNTSADTDFSLTTETDHDTYIKGVEKIKNHIVAGDIIQAVYSQPFSSTIPVNPVMLYRAQRYINPSPYMFFMNMGKIAIAGSSPETMVRLENRTATIRPIAGTRPRGTTEQEDRQLADELLNDEKERAEHLMLVDLGRNDLGRVSETGTVQVTDMMFVERYSHVMHLVSNITGEMKEDMDAWDLLQATFPAGTLSGAPKIRAMEIIAELEKSPRGIYGGAAGYISFSGNMDLAITIRTATVENGKMKVQSGAGIVADSQPETEYQECINKARSVERAMKLALSANNGGSSC
ncbi:Anthranilate synthase component 1 [Desulfamplus magnetovallimortis]|uniref:Anthranilate synthase component 1 n=1 Tax=Desulfamplus magnetovallimortis TaxID=1246637 RepID=A0A1W1HLH1_9BACT|nr:anthranilate synthase component I family protein [Desulfamplus magnetovallimortis]SLM33198.1 Anthranilate synthase component 1 [Desulfamplus magnetovallimortis]